VSSGPRVRLVSPPATYLLQSLVTEALTARQQLESPLSSVDDEYRAVGVVHHLVADAAHDELAKAGQATTADDHQRGVQFPGAFDDAVGRIARGNFVLR